MKVEPGMELRIPIIKESQIQDVQKSIKTNDENKNRVSEISFIYLNNNSEYIVKKTLFDADQKRKINQGNICFFLQKHGHLFPFNYLCKVKKSFLKQSDDGYQQQIVIMMPLYDDTLHSNLQNKYFFKLKPYRLTKTLLSLMISITACRKIQFIHGDLKPHNIFTTNTNDIRHIVIGDFGCSISQKNKNLSLGTRFFMSPEMFLEYFTSGKHPRKQHAQLSDIFSLGVVLAMLYNSDFDQEVPYLFDENLQKKFEEIKFDDNNTNNGGYDPNQLQIIKSYYAGIVGWSGQQKLATFMKYNYSQQQNKVMSIILGVIKKLIMGNYNHRFTIFELYQHIMQNAETKRTLFSVFSQLPHEVEFKNDFEKAYQLEVQMYQQYLRQQHVNPGQNRLRNLRCYRNINVSQIVEKAKQEQSVISISTQDSHQRESLSSQGNTS